MSLLNAVRRALSKVVREYRYASAGESARIKFYPLVKHGVDVKLTGRIDFGSEPFLVTLGSHITVADGVRFITHDGAVRLFRDEHPNAHIYDRINVHDHVFIGIGAIIMPGVTIGERSIVGAGSVVTKDVPSETVVAGVPAKPIKTLAEYRESALSKAIDWPAGKYDDEWRRHLEETI